MTLPPLQGGENPVTIPENYPSAAGLAFGLISSEKEGVGMGRCVIVLTGGRSGGHKAAVLGAVRSFSEATLFMVCDCFPGFPPHQAIDSNVWSMSRKRRF